MPNKLDPQQWAAQLSQLGKNWPAEAFSIFLRYMALTALRGVVYRSPVGDPDFWKMKPPPGYIGGQFRGNWDVSIGDPNASEPTGVDPHGEATFAQGSATIGQLGPKNINRVWLLNNLAYAVRLEEGWSWQAPGPGGIVGITATEIINATAPNSIFSVMRQ